jgi:hypothetical protein
MQYSEAHLTTENPVKLKSKQPESRRIFNSDDANEIISDKIAHFTNEWNSLEFSIQKQLFFSLMKQFSKEEILLHLNSNIMVSQLKKIYFDNFQSNVEELCICIGQLLVGYPLYDETKFKFSKISTEEALYFGLKESWHVMIPTFEYQVDLLISLDSHILV